MEGFGQRLQRSSSIPQSHVFQEENNRDTVLQDDVLSPPDAILEHAEHLLLATRLQLSQLSNCLNESKTPTVTHDREQKRDSEEGVKNLFADKSILKDPTMLKPKELVIPPLNAHHKKRKNKDHLPGCRYHNESVNNKKQSGDQGKKHHKDLISKNTTRSHLQWQFLPSVNIKQNFQIQQGPSVTVPTSSCKHFSQLKSNVQVIEAVHNSYGDNCNEKLNHFSMKSETNNIPSPSMQLTLDSKAVKMDINRRNYDKTSFDTKSMDSETEYSSYENKVSPNSKNEFSSNKIETKVKVNSIVSKAVHDVKFSSHDSKFKNKATPKVHNKTLLNHQTQLVTKGMALKHKRIPGVSKLVPRQSSKPMKKKPIVCKLSYPSQYTPKTPVHQINNSLLLHSGLTNRTPSKNYNSESDDTLSNKTQKSCDEPSKIIPNSISNVGHDENDLLIHSTPQYSLNIHTNSEIECSNQVRQPCPINVVDIQNEWHTQWNTSDTLEAIDNNDAKMKQLELSVFNAISSEVLSGLLHNVQSSSSQNSRKKLDLEVDKTTFMVQNLQSNYSRDECYSEDRSLSENNVGDQSYDDDFEDEDDRQNNDKYNEMESSETVQRKVSNSSDNSEPINKNENSEVEVINYRAVENNTELNPKSPSFSPKEISNSSLRSASPPSLSKEQSTHDIPEVTVRNKVISPEDFSHSYTQNLGPNYIKSPMPTPTQECSLHTTPVSSCSLNYFPLDFYKSLQPNLTLKETVSQKIISKESPENTNNVSSLESDSSSTSQTEMNLTESLSLGEIAPNLYSLPSSLNFQKMDMNWSESLSSGEINPKVSQLKFFQFLNKNHTQSEGGISLNYDQYYGCSSINERSLNWPTHVLRKKINHNGLPEENPHRINIEHSEGELTDSLDIFDITGIGSSSLSPQ